MPISYALLLCVPIGFLFFWIGRLCSLYLLGRYAGPERRASMAFGVFGALLIPDIWIIGNLQEEFSGMIGMVIGYSFFWLRGSFSWRYSGRIQDAARKGRGDVVFDRADILRVGGFCGVPGGGRDSELCAQPKLRWEPRVAARAEGFEGYWRGCRAGACDEHVGGIGV